MQLFVFILSTVLSIAVSAKHVSFSQRASSHVHQANKRQVTYGYPPASTDWRNEQRYVVMDNDWGSTGFIPYLLALNANMTVLGLVGSTGDTWALQSTLHGLATLEHGNLSCIPVARGTNYPLYNTVDRFRSWTSQYGTLAWSGVFAPENATAEGFGANPTSGDPDRISRNAFFEGYPNMTYANQSAADFMIEQVFKYPGQVSIYTGAPMTNVALAIQANSSFASTAKELVVMGGYVDQNLFQITSPLNQDLGSDINFIIDSEAAHIALTVNFSSITVTANVANQQYLTPDVIAAVNSSNSPYKDLLEDFFLFLPLWDETTAMVMAYPDVVVNSTSVYIDVSMCYESPFLGKTYLWGEGFQPNTTRKVNFVTEIDQALYYERLTEAMSNPKQCVDGVPA